MDSADCLLFSVLDRISRRSQVVEGIVFSDLKSPNDVILRVWSNSDLLLTLWQFAAKCEAATMRISVSKSEGMILGLESLSILGSC